MQNKIELNVPNLSIHETIIDTTAHIVHLIKQQVKKQGK